MNTKNKNICHCDDDNLIKIIVHETPQTSTLQRVVDTLSVLDASITEITDQQISAIRDSVDDLSSNFNTFSTSTSAHFSTLDTSVNALDASIKSLTIDSIAGLNARFDALSTKTDDISTRLDASITDLNVLLSFKISDVSSRLSDASLRVKTNADAISDICTRLYHTISNVVDNAVNIADVSTRNKIAINDISTRLFYYIRDYDRTYTDVSNLKTLTASHTSRLDSIETHLISLDDSVGYLRTERNRLDASISSLTNYVDTTVTQILSTDRARINAIESLAVDTSAYVHDSLTAYSQRLNSSLNQFNSHLDASLSQYYTAFDERDVVIARALNLHDASILNLIERVTALENA